MYYEITAMIELRVGIISETGAVLRLKHIKSWDFNYQKGIEWVKRTRV